MPTQVSTDEIKTIAQDSSVCMDLARLSEFASNADCAYFQIRHVLRLWGYDFAEYVDTLALGVNNGCLELALSTVFGDRVDGTLFMQWNSNTSRAGEIVFNAFIN